MKETKGHSLGKHCEIVNAQNGSCKTITLHNNLLVIALNGQFLRPLPSQIVYMIFKIYPHNEN